MENDVTQSKKPDNRWTDVAMLGMILGCLSVVFLGGIGILVGIDNYKASDLVAVLAPILGVISTVSAGVFGYALGSRGTTDAHQTAAEASRAGADDRQRASESAAAAGNLVDTIDRIVGQAKRGGPSGSGKHELSDDDLTTLLSVSGSTALGARVSRRNNPESQESATNPE